MKVSGYRRSYRAITRKNNPVQLHQLDDEQLLQHIIGVGADKLLQYVDDNPHLWELTPSEMLRILASLDGIGYVTALRYMSLQIYTLRQQK